MFAANRANAPFNGFGKVEIFNISKVSFQVKARVVIAFLVGTANNISDAFKRFIDIICAIIRNSVRSDITCHKSAIRCNIGSVDFFTHKISELCFVYFKIASDKCNHIFVSHVFLINNRFAR